MLSHAAPTVRQARIAGECRCHPPAGALHGALQQRQQAAARPKHSLLRKQGSGAWAGNVLHLRRILSLLSTISMGLGALCRLHGCDLLWEILVMEVFEKSTDFPNCHTQFFMWGAKRNLWQYGRYLGIKIAHIHFRKGTQPILHIVVVLKTLYACYRYTVRPLIFLDGNFFEITGIY